MNDNIKTGDRIRLELNYGEIKDFTVEEFRNCLGIFVSDAHREACEFTPLCTLYGRGPDSENEYISNYGEYISNQVPLYMNIPATASKGEANDQN